MQGRARLHGAVSRGGHKHVLVVLAPAAVVQPVGGVKGPDLTHGAAAGGELEGVWEGVELSVPPQGGGPKGNGAWHARPGHTAARCR